MVGLRPVFSMARLYNLSTDEGRTGVVRVYLDQVFVLNLCVNYLLLRGAAQLGASAVRRRRLLLAAGVGAVYAVAVYLPGCAFLQRLPVKLLCGAALPLLAFGAKKTTLRLGAVFACLSLVLCGAVYAVECLKHGAIRLRGDALFYPVTFGSVVLTAGAVYAACRLLLPRLTHAADSIVPVTLTLRGRRVRLSALRDTGNTLCDPVSGQSVLVAEWRSARQLLPFDLQAEDFQSPAALALRLKEYHPRLIPYRAVGTASGLLLALPCTISIGKQSATGLVAFSPSPLSDGGGYDALTGGIHYA